MRYWVIAPNENGALYESVWNFDLEQSCISIGWAKIGDVSKMTRDQLQEKVVAAYPESAHTLVTNMLWNFYHEIKVGDVIVARRGLRVISGVGTVEQKAQFLPGTNDRINHPHFLKVSWHAAPRNVSLGANIFHPRSVAEIPREKFEIVTNQAASAGSLPAAADTAIPVIENPEITSEQMLLFGIEKELESFLVSNWGSVFRDLEVYVDENGRDGQQYPTEIGPIDILAVERQSGNFVVIELKRNRSSDQALGQVQRYMGWVKATLCRDNQKKVRGLIVCGEEDPRLTYAMTVTQNIKLQYYKVSFSLSDEPPKRIES